MCFLKALKPLDEMTFDRDSFTDDSSCQETPKNFPFGGCSPAPSFAFKAPQLSRQEQLLTELMSFIHANNSRLAALHQKLSRNEQHLVASQLELQDLVIQGSPRTSAAKTADLHIPQKQCHQLSTPESSLHNKLFGAKEYNYRLELQEEIPTTIFKERNINIPLSLVDRNGQKVLNSNIIHLCLGLCDANGEWVSVNRLGESFMKGKTEVEMYHGEGSFLKVYPRDISRHYPEGKLSFVVYSKPSVIQFSSNTSSVEKIVNSSQIQPLLIQGIQIKAKKC